MPCRMMMMVVAVLSVSMMMTRCRLGRRQASESIDCVIKWSSWCSRWRVLRLRQHCLPIVLLRPCLLLSLSIRSRSLLGAARRPHIRPLWCACRSPKKTLRLFYSSYRISGGRSVPKVRTAETVRARMKVEDRMLPPSRRWLPSLPCARLL